MESLDKFELEIAEKGLGYEFRWKQNDTNFGAIELQDIEKKKDSLTALAKFLSYMPGYKPLLIERHLNLLSVRTVQAIIREVEGICPELPWRAMFEQMLHLLLQKLAKLEVEVVTPQDKVPQQTYLIWPLLPEGLPTILFGAAGSGKSYLAQYLSLLVQVGMEDSGPRNIKVRFANTLYLDFEGTKEEFSRRLKRLASGMLLPYIELNYVRGVRPLKECFGELKAAMDENQARLLVIDSLGPAAGGDLNSAETAIAFFEALRRLNATSLIIAHVPKSGEREKTVFGSSYFSNLARMIWEVKGVSEGNVLNLGFYNRKSNVSRLHDPIGFRLIFGEDRTEVEATDVKKIPELDEQLPLPQRIRNALSRGSKTFQELAEELDVNFDSLKKTLNRMKKKGEIVNIKRGKWGLAA